MTDNTQELNEITIDLWVKYGRPGTMDEFVLEAKQAITSLIKERELKARLDEIEHIVSGSEYSDDDFGWYEITKEEYCGTKYYSDTKHLDRDERIAQLEAQLNPKGGE